MKFQEQMYNIKMLYCYIISAYHLYGKPRNFGENSNGTVHKGGNFPEKSNTFRVITVFLFLQKLPKFSLPFVWTTSARLHVERKWTIYRYFVNGTTQSCSCFQCQKNTSNIWRKIFNEISKQMVSAPCNISYFIVTKTLFAVSSWCSRHW